MGAGLESSIYFPNLHIYLQHVGKNFDVFGISIAFYGVTIGIGMLLGVLFLLREARITGQNEDAYLDISMIVIVCSVIGARLYYVVFSWDLYRDNLLSIFNIRQGGLAIYGGVLAGILSGIVVARAFKIPFFKGADTVILGLVIGQIIGRWGNFFNREAFGGYSDGLFAMQLPLDAIRSMDDVTAEMLAHAQTIGGTTFVSVHPTFLYESLWNLGLFLILLWYRRRKRFEGEIFFLYLLGYGVGRCWIENLRTDQLLLWHTQLPVSQLLAVLLIVISAARIGFYYLKNLKKS